MEPQINFSVNPPIEFINSLFLVSQQENLLQRAEKVNFTTGLAELELFNQLQDELSDYMESEVDYFFAQELPIGYLMGLKVILEEDSSSVKEFINQLEEKNPLELIKYVLCRHGIDTEPEARMMAEEIKKADNLADDLKNRLLEMVNNPVEMLQRYWFMVRQFYLKSYKRIEDQIVKEAASHREKLEGIYEEDSEYFIKYYLKLSEEELSKPISVHVSFFFQTMHDYSEFDGRILVNMGCYLDQVYGEEAFRERLQEFLQFVADKTRFRMLELLASKAHYGRELADELDIKPSTVSYHLSRLEKMDLVIINRQKNKVFYELDRNRLTELFGQAGDFILRSS